MPPLKNKGQRVCFYDRQKRFNDQYDLGQGYGDIGDYRSIYKAVYKNTVTCNIFGDKDGKEEDETYDAVWKNADKQKY